MKQKLSVYLKTITVVENGHYREHVEASNVLIATWKQPNYANAEMMGTAALELEDGVPFNGGIESKWRLFKCEVEGGSAINFLLTNTIEAPAAMKVIFAKAALVYGTVLGAVPVVGVDIVEALKKMPDTVYKVAKGELIVPKNGLPAGDHTVPLKMPQDLRQLKHGGFKMHSGRTGRPNSTYTVLVKGSPNGTMVVTVEVDG